MKFLRKIISFVVIFSISLLFCAVVGITMLSYQAVNELAKAATPVVPLSVQAKKTAAPALVTPASADPNLKDLVHIGLEYKTEFEIFDKLMQEISQKPVPEFCHVLCNPSAVDKTQASEQRSLYLARYYDENGRRALEDPVFRLKVMEIDFLSRLFPESLRELLAEIGSVNSATTKWQKMALAVKFETSVVKEISAMTLRLERMQLEADKFKEIRQLIKSCQQGAMTTKQVREHCAELSL